MENNKHNHLHDPFTEQVRQKLEHHQMPVEADVWKGIQKQITPEKRFVPAWVYVSISVAAGLALIFSLGNYLFLNQVSEENAVEMVQNQTEIVRPDVVQETVEDDTAVITTSAIPEKPVLNPSLKKKTLAQVEKLLVVETSDPFAAQQSEPEIAVVDEVIPVITPKPQEERSTETAENSVQQKSTKKLTELVDELAEDWTDLIRKKKDNQAQLAAGFGSGIGSSSVTLTPRSRAYRGESLVDVETNFSSILTPNDFYQKEYLPPVSLGLSVRLPLDERFAVESGLVYTYLLTRLSGSRIGDYRADVNLHYLGVPVNFVASLLKEKNWEIYLAAGGMLEKGLRSDYNQYQNFDGTQIVTDANTAIEGVQWSLNGTLGVSYAIGEQVSVYLDPKLSYYFENEQPFSIRKELPLLIGVNAGVRMSL